MTTQTKARKRSKGSRTAARPRTICGLYTEGIIVKYQAPHFLVLSGAAVLLSAVSECEVCDYLRALGVTKARNFNQ